MRPWKSSAPWVPRTHLLFVEVQFAFHSGCIYPHPFMLRLRTILGMFSVPGLCSAVAIAAEAPAGLPPPPNPNQNQNAPAVWVGMLLMFIIVAVIVSISMMPSRRGHQD